MLVLTRKQGQEIHIGQDITIKVIKTGSTVKIGIDAPKAVRVLRAEVEPLPASDTTPPQTSRRSSDCTRPQRGQTHQPRVSAAAQPPSATLGSDPHINTNPARVAQSDEHR